MAVPCYYSSEVCLRFVSKLNEWVKMVSERDSQRG